MRRTVVGSQMSMVEQFDGAVAAYGRGNYASALTLWDDLAVQGCSPAQYNFGLMHAKGQGVAKDHAWRRNGTAGRRSRAMSLRGRISRRCGVPGE